MKIINNKLLGLKTVVGGTIVINCNSIYLDSIKKIDDSSTELIIYPKKEGDGAKTTTIIVEEPYESLINLIEEERDE